MSNTPASSPATASIGAGTSGRQVFMVVAPSGAGKSSLVNALLANDGGISLSVSFTTRPPRPGELDGREYHFVDRAEFERRKALGEFLESAEVHGNFYATSRREIEERLDAGTDVLLEIDWQGARQVRARLPEARSVFILPPSRAALEARLRQRSTDSDEVIRRRLRDSVDDLGHWAEFDFVVVNDRFEQALRELEDITQDRGAALTADRPAVGRLAAELLA